MWNHPRSVAPGGSCAAQRWPAAAGWDTLRPRGWLRAIALDESTHRGNDARTVIQVEQTPEKDFNDRTT